MEEVFFKGGGEVVQVYLGVVALVWDYYPSHIGGQGHIFAL